MESIDLFEFPLKVLQLDAKRRRKILICLLLGWLLVMIGLFSASTVLKEYQENRITELHSKKVLLEPRIAHYQDLQKQHETVKRSKCAAHRLKTLFASPVKGLHLSAIEVTDRWLIRGESQNAQALDAYQIFINDNFSEVIWEEDYSEGILGFHVRGKISC